MTDDASAARLYEVFAVYSSAGRAFCPVCYSPAEIEHLTRTGVAHLDLEYGRKLLWETHDHWESADVYRHYLPRLLELLGPPWALEDLYPLHLSETLIALGFRRWPHTERRIVLEYLEGLRPELERRFDQKDREEWAAGIASLEAPEPLLPGRRDGEGVTD